MASLFARPQDAARAVLSAAWNGNAAVTPKAGQFLGQVSVDDEPLSERQVDWLSKLLSRANLPPLSEGGRQ